MARQFSTEDAKRVIAEHQEMLRDLANAQTAAQSYREEIVTATTAMITEELLRVLKGIPIEELNRDKRGFRIKALKDYGYNTIADIATLSVNSLASVHGISYDTAFSIKCIVDDMAKNARQGLKISLSLDKKTNSATKLVSAVSKYRLSQSAAERCNRLLNKYQSQVVNSIEELKIGTTSLRWFFTSGSVKKKAEAAYQYLLGLKEGDLFDQGTTLLARMENIKSRTSATCWDDFGINSILFFNILEEICPGLLGTQDSTYGLPEELAQEIQDQCFFPKGLRCTLRNYQEWGVKYILHQGKVLLGDEMGLGKTVQAIATMVSLKNTGATHFMVICPASVIENWCREIRQHSLLTVTKIYGANREAAFQSWLKRGGVAVSTYETTAVLKFDDGYKFTLLVVDEAHYIKNPEARRSINVRSISLHAERLLFMTGTALENKVDEMVSLISVLQPYIAAKIKGMESLSAAPRFRQLVAPVYYRRKREDVIKELPDLIESPEWCTLGKLEEQEYENAVLSKNYANARRVSWNVSDIKESSKARRMLEIIQEAESEGRKVIVFSFFLDTIQKVVQLLGRRCVNPINGSVSPQRRQEIIDEFTKAPAGTVLPAQIQSAGTGLNIQSASVVIICEPQFKPSIENQAISRAYRMGQSRNVLVYRLLCQNTVDEKLMENLAKKQRTFDAFADKSEAAEKETYTDNQQPEVDAKTFGKMIEEEIDRINKKRASER